MTDREHPTDPYAAESFSPTEQITDPERFAALVKAALEPVREEITRTRVVAEQTGRYVIDLVRRYDDLRRDVDTLRTKVAALEKKTGLA